MPETRVLSCANCTVANCARLDKGFPDFCPTAGMKAGEIESSVTRYMEDPADREIALTASKVESDYYCVSTRAEEVLIFAKRMG